MSVCILFSNGLALTEDSELDFELEKPATYLSVSGGGVHSL